MMNYFCSGLKRGRPWLLLRPASMVHLANRFLTAILFVVALLLGSQAQAALTVTSVTLNGGASTTVAPGATFVVVVSETNTGGSNWRSVWFVTTDSVGATVTTCIDTPDHNGNGTYSETFNFTAPAVVGTYGVSVRANSSNSSCGGTNSSTVTLAGGIVVVAAPSVITNAASSLTTIGATLNGTVSSNGASTTVTFDLSLTAAYSSSVTVSASTLASNASNAAVSAAVTGLLCSTSYHYRAKGVNSAGTTVGGDVIFTTSACPTPTVTSISTASTNRTIANSSVQWTVVFNTAVTGVDTADFVLAAAGGVTGATLSAVTGGGTTWTVTANTGTGIGTLGLNVADNDTIVNSVGVPLGGVGAGNGNFTGQVYTVAAPAPVLAKVASTAAAVVGDVVTFTITASNPYSVDMTAITVSDVLPTGMTYATSVSTLGAVSNTGQTVSWSIPTLVAGASAQLTLAVKLTQQGALTNTVTSTGSVSASASVLVLASAVTHFHLDEPVGSWNGTLKEVIDSGGNHTSGSRVTTAPTATNTVSPIPTIASQYASVVGGFCNAANFDGNGVVAVPHNAVFDYTTRVSASAWIYPTAYPSSDLYSILSNDQNYEFHLNPTGKLYWWWGGNPMDLTSAATIPLNKWTHIAITMDSSATGGRERIYINGVADTNINNWKGTLNSNPCTFYIGGDVTTGSCALIPARNFHGMIDEVKLYGYELSAAEVQADMTLGRNCSGTFDHIRIEHDGAGSICTPETVTVKACLDPFCSTLYTGNVTVNMSPTGWVGGNQLVLTNGVGSIALSNSTAGNVTLGTASVSPTAANATRCFVGSTETCTLNFANASCSFDAVETGAAPKTRLYTKLAGTSFNVDVLALNSSSTINTGYTGTVSTDLVDASASGCPSGTGLTTAQSLAFAAANAGRKPVTFNYAGAAKNVRVRMTVGAGTPACSTDNFTIRPPAFSSVYSTNANADSAGSSTSAVPTLKTGAAFNITADTGKAGYDGTPKVDTTLIEWPNVPSGGRAAPGAGTLSGGATLTTAAASTTGNGASGNYSYDEAGYFRIKVDGVYDDVFTTSAGDQAGGDCVAGSFSNTANASGKFGCNFGNSAVSNHMGRFIPDHFDTVVMAPMNCTGLAFAIACPGNGLVYSGQPFSVRVTANNSVGATTQNYSGAFAKAVTLSAVDASGGGAIATAAPGGTLTTPPALLPPATAAASSFSGGSNAATLANPIFTFTTVPTTPTNVFVRATDTDAVSSLRTTAAASVEGGLKVVSGRIRIPNAYGSERLPLPIIATVQYFNGIFWVASLTDNVTSFNTNLSTAGGNLVTNVIKGPITGVTVTNPGAGTVTAGVRTFTLVAPLATGSVDLQLNAPVFLPSAPVRATFGIYKSPLIYRRENY